MTELDVSNSQVSTFLRCKRAHYYSYGMKIQSKKPSVAMTRGNMGHVALAQYYNSLKLGSTHKVAVKDATVALRDEAEFYPTLDTDTLLRELGSVLSHYFRTYEREASEIEVLEVEKSFEVQITADFSLPFIVDLILRHPRYGVEAWDHKFVWDFWSNKVVDLDPQLPLYYAGLKMFGYHSFGVRYNELRYRDTIENKNHPETRFKRPAPTITPSNVITTMDEHIETGREIYRLKQLPLDVWEKSVVRTRNNQACRNCPFAAICTGDLNGEDRGLYLGYDYEPKVRRR